MQWEEIIKHVTQRFLSLGPAVERIIKIWPVLISHFLEFRNECTRSIEKIITNEDEEKRTLAYLSFAYNFMFSVEVTMQKIELKLLRCILKCMGFVSRSSKERTTSFLAVKRESMRGLTADANELIKNDFLQFYNIFTDYLSRYDFSENNILSKVLFLNIKSEINYNNFQEAAKHFKIEEINMDCFYEESTRPDIAYSVSYLSQFNNCYSYIHWNYAKRILKYLLKTKGYCLRYSREAAELEGFVDADWASDSNDRRSYTGFCFMKSGSAVSWESKKQRTVALSSCEAEYMALSEACREAIYLNNLMYELNGIPDYKIVIYNDSQSALKLANSHQFHKRSKHIDVRYNLIRDVIDSGSVETKYLPSVNMPADLLTKGLSGIKHYKCMETLGIVQKYFFFWKCS